MLFVYFVTCNSDRVMIQYLVKGGDTLSIKYDKLIKKMQEAGINSYVIKRDKIIGQATYKKILEGGDIDTRSIDKLCKALNCQPGDILEYVEDNAQEDG